MTWYLNQLMKAGGWGDVGVVYVYVYNHGGRNYKDTNPKCRLHWCLIKFIDWRYSQSQSVMLVFSNPL
jgi:hypothetical protein